MAARDLMAAIHPEAAVPPRGLAHPVEQRLQRSPTMAQRLLGLQIDLRHGQRRTVLLGWQCAQPRPNRPIGLESPSARFALAIHRFLRRAVHGCSKNRGRDMLIVASLLKTTLVDFNSCALQRGSSRWCIGRETG